MISTRYKIIFLIVLNVLIILLPERMYYVNIILLILFGFLLKRDLLYSLKLICLYLAILFILSISINHFFTDTSLEQLLRNSLKLFTIISLSILLVTNLNIMELVAFLNKIKLPAKVSIAIGVGFRYIELLMEDIKRINFIQTMSGYGITIQSVKRNGFLKTISVFSLPLFLSLLKRTENISLSILIQDIEQRSKNYSFKRTTITEYIVITFILLLMLTILCIRLKDITG